MESPGKENLLQEEFEANENLAGFFRLLLKVDKRVNPQNYEEGNGAGIFGNEVSHGSSEGEPRDD